MIKNFDIWPLHLDKNNLFEQQKIFIIYLMGLIPENNDWTTQVEYLRKLEEIKNIKTIELSQTDIDLATLQDRDIEEIKRERLLEYKNNRRKELKEKYGIKEEKKEEIHIEGLPENDGKSQKKELWDLLQGKGLIKEKKKKTDKNNGL